MAKIYPTVPVDPANTQTKRRNNGDRNDGRCRRRQRLLYNSDAARSSAAAETVQLGCGPGTGRGYQDFLRGVPPRERGLPDAGVHLQAMPVAAGRAETGYLLRLRTADHR